MGFPVVSTPDVITRFGVTFVISSSAAVIKIENFITTGYVNSSTYAGLFQIEDPDGIIIYQNAGLAGSTPSYASPDISGATSTWSVNSICSCPLDSDGNIKKGIYTFRCLSSINGSGGWVVVKTHDYKYTTPIPSLTWTISCKTSTITVTNSTEYDVVYDGVTVTPTMTHVLKLIKPPTAGCNSPSDSTTFVNTFGGGNTAATDMWTKWWTAKNTTISTYVLELWGAYNFFSVVDTITGEDATEVDCFDVSCLYTCVMNLFNAWKAVIGVNLVEEEKLHLKVEKVIVAWTSYEMALEKGEDVSPYVNEILAIVQSVNCQCPSADDNHSHRVIAWQYGGGGSTGSATLPNGAWHLYTNGTTVSDLYYNATLPFAFTYSGSIPSATGWVFVTHLEGVAGTGTPGTNGTSASILYNETSTSSCAASGGVQILKKYTLPANLLAVSGDMLSIFALFELSTAADGGKKVGLSFGAMTPTQLIAYVSDSLPNNYNNYVGLEATITMNSVTNQTCVAGAKRFGTPGAIHSPLLTITTKNLGVDQDINATALSATSTAADIMCKQLEIEIRSYTNGLVPSYTVKQGSISLTGGAPAAAVVFATAFAAVDYTPNLTVVDGSGEWQPVTLTSKTVSGFSLSSLVDVTVWYTCILV